MDTRVIVGTPCYGGLVTHVYMHSVIKLLDYAASSGIGMALWTQANDSLVPRARNTLLARFLDTPSATHLMFIDADIGFGPEQFQRLVSFDGELVAGMYPIKSFDWAKAQRLAAAGASVDQLRESGLHFVGVPCAKAEREERDGFVTGEYAGAGFMLIRRSVVERLVAAYPETKYRAAHLYGPPPQASDTFYNLFDCIIEPQTGTYLSEDFTFCHRWRRIGGKVWLDTRSQLRHLGSYEFAGRVG
jgi:hypothetical protein